MFDRMILKLRSLVHFFLHFNIYMGKSVILYGVPKILYGKNIKFGKNVRINDCVYLHGSEGIELGDNTTLSYGSSIISESYDIGNYESYINRKHRGAPVKIGKNVWICANVTIVPGVTIADNIVVGAGAVVVGDLLEENSIYAGNPAKFIKKMES